MYNRVRRTTGKESVFFGVCGGLSKYIDPEADPVIIRLIFTFMGIFSGIVPMVILYLVLALVLKRKEVE